jgi:protein arginine N-methyltransferase 1
MADDTYYFDSYSNFDVHETMIKDKVRTNGYRTAISTNPSLFRRAVVLDVGCGTGILSLFAAKAGADKVYAVEKSQIGDYAKAIVDKNDFSGRIEVLQGSMEEIELPETVDVIISEWMGYCLLYESMLPSVILARDKFLEEGGTMWPNRAKMFISGIRDSTFIQRKFGFWDDVFGFNLSAVKRFALSEPVIAVAPNSDIITDDSPLIDLDLNTVTVHDLNVNATFSLTALEAGNLNGFVVWFDVAFEGPDAQFVLSTSPFQPPTHWSQTLFYFPEAVEIEADVRISGRFMMTPSRRNRRDQDVMISFTYGTTEYTFPYKMR